VAPRHRSNSARDPALAQDTTHRTIASAKKGGPSPGPRKSSSVKDALRLGHAYDSQMNAPHSAEEQCFSIHKIVIGLDLRSQGHSFRWCESLLSHPPDPPYERSHAVTMPVERARRTAVTTVEVNGRSYKLPMRPTVVIVVDGFDPAYLEHGFANGTLPRMKSFGTKGFVGIADCSMPSTTNTNNTSIVTGVPPAVHGINGNYYLDPETGKEIMITDASRLRCGTILGAMSDAGRKDGGCHGKGQAAQGPGLQDVGHPIFFRIRPQGQS